jgi:hypothetical protein
MIAHYENWGWINFLSGIAETKMFDIPKLNLDSIECAKRARAYKVLLFASEKKEFNVAMNEAYKSK